jgi:hypothetical protein
MIKLFLLQYIKVVKTIPEKTDEIIEKMYKIDSKPERKDMDFFKDIKHFIVDNKAFFYILLGICIALTISFIIFVVVKKIKSNVNINNKISTSELQKEENIQVLSDAFELAENNDFRNAIITLYRIFLNHIKPHILNTKLDINKLTNSEILLYIQIDKIKNGFTRFCKISNIAMFSDKEITETDYLEAKNLIKEAFDE